VRQIDLSNIEELARGCAVLGTGGGGETRTAAAAVRHAIREHGPVEVIGIDDLSPEDVIMPLSGVGAPTVSAEMMPGLGEAARLRDAAEEIMGRAVAAVMASEIGGGNGVMPAAWAAQLGLPLVDADGMGRAFPELPMVSMYVAGVPVRPMAMTDVYGNVSIVRATDAASSERIGRAICVAGGCHVLMSDYLMTAAEAASAVVHGTISKAVELGNLLLTSPDPIGRLAARMNGRVLMTGKIVDVERRITGGFTRGYVSVSGAGMDDGRSMRIEVQNEFLVALEQNEVRACVPDSIVLVHAETGEAVATENVRYGQRVTILAWPSVPIWRTDRGLQVAGPGAFGYEFGFVPVEQRVEGIHTPV